MTSSMEGDRERVDGVQRPSETEREGDAERDPERDAEREEGTEDIDREEEDIDV